MYCTPSKPKAEGYDSIPTTVKQTDQLARCEHTESNIILNNFTTVITFPGMDLLGGGGMRGRARCALPNLGKCKEGCQFQYQIRLNIRYKQKYKITDFTN
jgi:hypothetical protein